MFDRASRSDRNPIYISLEKYVREKLGKIYSSIFYDGKLTILIVIIIIYDIIMYEK
jgi:hypothetical protein